MIQRLYSARQHQNSKKTMTPKQYQCRNSRINSIHLYEEILSNLWATQRQTVHFIQIEWVKTLQHFPHSYRVKNVGKKFAHSLPMESARNGKYGGAFATMGKLLKCGENAHTHAIHGVPLHYNEMWNDGNEVRPLAIFTKVLSIKESYSHTHSDNNSSSSSIYSHGNIENSIRNLFASAVSWC